MILLSKKVQDKQVIMSDLREIQQKINSYNKEIQWKKKEIKKIEDKISTGGALNLKEEKKKLKDLTVMV